MAGFAIPQAMDPISGIFDNAKFIQGFALLVTNGVRAWEDPPDKLSIVSAISSSGVSL